MFYNKIMIPIINEHYERKWKGIGRFLGFRCHFVMIFELIDIFERFFLRYVSQFFGFEDNNVGIYHQTSQVLATFGLRLQI